VLECRLVLDPRTRESRGFGFVTMDQLEDAERCIKYLNRSTLEGRMITVEKVRVWIGSRFRFTLNNHCRLLCMLVVPFCVEPGCADGYLLFDLLVIQNPARSASTNTTLPFSVFHGDIKDSKYRPCNRLVLSGGSTLGSCSSCHVRGRRVRSFLLQLLF